MADPFRIKIYGPDGNPEGVRIIDRMNWTGLDIVFPRDQWTSSVNDKNLANLGSISSLVRRKTISRRSMLGKEMG